MDRWYSRLADVPKVVYEGSPGVKRTRLPGHDVKPIVSQYKWEGTIHEELWWPSKDGQTSAAPASQWQTTPQPGETPAQIALRQCNEALELPGTLSDYHFIIQQCHEELWEHRRREPWTLLEVERLCWLDLRLIKTYPEIVRIETQDKNIRTEFAAVLAFQHLIDIYEHEGFLQEALAVAKLAVQFMQLQSTLERIEDKIRILEAEDAT